MKDESIKEKLVIYWTRRDFRLSDNPALTEAVKQSENTSFLPVFILEDYMIDATPKFQFGYPSRYFLSHAIEEFSKNFNMFLLITGKGAQTFINLQKKLEMEVEIHVNEDIYEDFYKQIVKLKKHNIKVTVYKDQLTINKEVRTGTGNIYSIFTPFKKAVWREFMTSPVLSKVRKEELDKLNYLNKDLLETLPHQVNISHKNIWSKFSKNRIFIVTDYKTGTNHRIDIDTHLDNLPKLDTWYFSEEEALKKVDHFVKSLLNKYKDNRDSLEQDAEGTELLSGKTSKLSLALTWGLVSARTIREKIQHRIDDDLLDVNWLDKNLSEERTSVLSYLSELVWREFYKYLLFHNPRLMQTEFQEKFLYKIKWTEEKEAMKRFMAWIKGETGYKIVDAAMLQLAQTGWMHNRSRMIVASVLTKNLGVDWRWGQEYFRAMLIDLDEASNNGGWQWGASVGADPKPIRIFNPYLQAENYDKSNIYQKKWLGEERFFFDLQPIVDHKEARADALKRYGLDKINNDSVRDY